jgi:DNA-binding MarR family transcriptional regulator
MKTKSEEKPRARGSCDAARGRGKQFGLSDGRHRSWGALLRAHARATERVGRHAEAEGALPLDWYDVLLALEYAPEGRLRMGELVEHVTLTRSGLTRLIDRIEAAGLVERHLCPSDRRAFETVLTQEGRKAREQSWPIYARAIAEGFGSRYTEEEAQLLAELLMKQVAKE